MRRKNANPFDIFDKRDVRFREFRGTMESVYQDLHSKGVGAVVRHTPIITKEEEENLWDKGIIGDHSPLALVRAVFYLNGRNFCLRGGCEHRGLKMSQLKREKDHWKYIENGSKNFRSGVADLRRENKVVRQYESPSIGKQCHVYLLDLYISKIPDDAKKKDVFYFTPLSMPADPQKPWYSSVPIGWNKLDSYVKDMCAEIGIEGKSNHSLRATGATRLSLRGSVRRLFKNELGTRVLMCFEYTSELVLISRNRLV